MTQTERQSCLSANQILPEHLNASEHVEMPGGDNIQRIRREVIEIQGNMRVCAVTGK